MTSRLRHQSAARSKNCRPVPIGCTDNTRFVSMRPTDNNIYAVRLGNWGLGLLPGFYKQAYNVHTLTDYHWMTAKYYVFIIAEDFG